MMPRCILLLAFLSISMLSSGCPDRNRVDLGEDVGDESEKGLPLAKDPEALSLTAAQLSSSCYPDAAASDGTLIFFAEAPDQSIRPLCLGLALDPWQALTVQSCDLPVDREVLVAVARSGRWELRRPTALLKAPFQALSGWMSAVGSLDAQFARWEEPLAVEAPRIFHGELNDYNLKNAFAFSLHYLAPATGTCPRIESISGTFAVGPFAWNLPLSMNAKAKSSELLAVMPRLPCRAYAPGSLLAIRRLKPETQESLAFAGLYARPSLFYESDCAARSEEIFLNIATAQRWILEQNHAETVP